MKINYNILILLLLLSLLIFFIYYEDHIDNKLKADLEIKRQLGALSRTKGFLSENNWPNRIINNKKDGNFPSFFKYHI